MENDSLYSAMFEADHGTSNAAKNFLGNLNLYGFNKELSTLEPEEVSGYIRKIMLKEIFIFKKDMGPDGQVYFVRDGEGNLIPSKGAKETNGITFAQIQSIYDLTEKPVNLDQLHEVIDSIQASLNELRNKNTKL